MDDLQYIKEKLDMLVKAVTGDPTDQTNPGMIIRLDRLEQYSKMLRNCLVLISGAIVAIIGNIVTKYI